jgi:ABC-type multidrug transport system fused ATPase/permease subunit
MALIAMGSGLVFVLLLRFVTITIRRYSKKIVEMEKEFAHYMYQLTSGIKVIKSVIPRIIIQKQSDKFATDFTDASLRFSVLYPLGTIFFQPLAALIIFITFFVSYGRPGFSFAVFTVLFYLIYRVISQVQAIQSVLQSLMSYLPHVSSFAFFHYALLQAREEVSKKGKPFMFNKNLRFSNIVFSYADRAPVLKDLSFSIEKGTSVGIIGISGAGKTTIADLLLRLLTPSAGKILIDGTDIKEFNLEDWRHNVGYVSQDPFLLHDSVKNNVKLYDEEISDDRVKKALESAYIKDLMEQLPLGYDTLVGDRGMTLSVGQRQRLILARIFARDPKLIILDEATSALDNESEAMVLNAIDNLRGKTTLLVITHRLSTVMNMGRLLILDSGHIIEEGSPQELLSDKSSYFYKMYHAGHKK